MSFKEAVGELDSKQNSLRLAQIALLEEQTRANWLQTQVQDLRPRKENSFQQLTDSEKQMSDIGSKIEMCLRVQENAFHAER